MKVKKFLLNVLPLNHRRDRRNSRETTSEFQRLAHSDGSPNVNFHRKFDVKDDKRQKYSSETSISVQNSIELEHLPGTSSSARFDDDFQVYNATTSGPLPSAEEDIFPVSVSDVRVKFRQIMVNGNETLGQVSEVYSSSGLRRRIKCCSCIQGSNALSFIFSFLAFVIVTITCTLLLIRELSHHVSTSTGSQDDVSDDLKTLMKRTWPLPDLKSENSTTASSWGTIEDTVNAAFSIFGNESDNNDNSDEESLVSTTSPSVATSGIYFKGHLVNQTLLEPVLSNAKQFLRDKLNDNSTLLDVLSWKGIARETAISDLEQQLNISSGPGLEGFLDDFMCNQDPVDLSCNRTTWYRSANGSCNNVLHPTKGSHFTPFRLILQPAESTTQKLNLGPGVTYKLTGGSRDRDPAGASAMLPLWAMFVMHDTLKIPNSPVACTRLGPDNAIALEQDEDRKACEANAEKCQSFPCPAFYPSCELGPSTSFNLATSYIDASHIYGSSEEKTLELRSMKHGKMQVVARKQGGEKDFLPLATDSSCLGYSGTHCFLSGDEDIHQLSALTALNTLFVREHNRIADWLHTMNPHWEEERLFQESRRIVIAQVQHVTYNEFLPEILGKALLNYTEVQLQTEGFYEGYSATVDASVSNAYAGAVGYFWYSMAVDKLQTIWKWGKHGGRREYDISAQILKPAEFLIKGKGHLEAIIRGMVDLAVNRVGLEFTPRLRSLHLKALNASVDVVQWILEKGEIFSLPPYVEWRKKCGFSDLKDFSQVKPLWSDRAFHRIKTVYGEDNLKNVDLFTGMLAEIPIPNARVGPLLACLLLDQFSRFKTGDRFWYEGDVYFHHFTESQLQSIRQTSLARILCENTDSQFDRVQKQPMLLPNSTTNPIVFCSDFDSLPSLDLHLWKDDPQVKTINYSKKNKLETSEDGSDEWNFETDAAESDEEKTENSVQIKSRQVQHSVVERSTQMNEINVNNVATLKD